jgi:hypothetical protein
MSPRENGRAPHEECQPESQETGEARVAEGGQQLTLPCLPIPLPRPTLDMVRIRRIAYV